MRARAEVEVARMGTIWLGIAPVHVSACRQAGKCGR